MFNLGLPNDLFTLGLKTMKFRLISPPRLSAFPLISNSPSSSCDPPHLFCHHVRVQAVIMLIVLICSILKCVTSSIPTFTD